MGAANGTSQAARRRPPEQGDGAHLTRTVRPKPKRGRAHHGDRPYADMGVFKDAGKWWVRFHGREAGPCASKPRTVAPAISAFLSLQAGSTRATKERDVRAMRRTKAHLEGAPHGLNRSPVLCEHPRAGVSNDFVLCDAPLTRPQ
jgi:hypothetical protein